jgi:hypothetical protein
VIVLRNVVCWHGVALGNGNDAVRLAHRPPGFKR